MATNSALTNWIPAIWERQLVDTSTGDIIHIPVIPTLSVNGVVFSSKDFIKNKPTVVILVTKGE